jgi:hypothetical protein
MSITAPPPPQLRAWRITDASVRAALCNAPLGQHPLLEAAYAWHERQRHRAVRPPNRYTSVIGTELDGVATRLARLLSPVATAIVAQNDPSRCTDPCEWVQVPATSYHRVARALNAAWRDRWDMLGANASRSGSGYITDEARSAAIALWRMAILSGGYQQPDGGLAVQSRTPAGRHALGQTARSLRFPITPGSGGNSAVLLIHDPARISDLLAEAAA